VRERAAGVRDNSLAQLVQDAAMVVFLRVVVLRCAASARVCASAGGFSSSRGMH
jgi:hypothetical protein